jgi:hypothetical protein
MTEDHLTIQGNDVVRRAYERMKSSAIRKAVDQIQNASKLYNGEIAEILEAIEREARTPSLKTLIAKYGEPSYVVRGFPVYQR